MNVLDTYVDFRSRWNEVTYEGFNKLGDTGHDIHGIKVTNTNSQFRSNMAYLLMATILVVAFFLGGLAVALLPTPLAITFGGIIGSAAMGGCWVTTRLFSDEKKVLPQVRGLRDEIKSVVTTMTSLQQTRKMLPEGSGFQNRIEEYCRLSYVLLTEVERLPSSVSGRDPHSHQILNEIRTKMVALYESGQELEALIHYKRSENTLTSIEMLGIDQYTDAISVETATHRALMSGDDVEDEREELSHTPGISVKKPIPPRPRSPKEKATW